MANKTLSQIPLASSPPGEFDTFVGVRNGNTDVQFTTSQMSSAFGGGGGGGGGGGPGGPAVAVSVIPPVTTGSSYGANFVIGGVLTFSNIFGGARGSGQIEFVRATCQRVQNVSWMLYLFNAIPTVSSFVDNHVAAIGPADVPKMLTAITLNPFNQLGAAVFTSESSGLGLETGTPNLWGVLVTAAPLTNSFTSIQDVTVEITAIQGV